MSAIPAQFGFGLWTAHFTPTYLGAPCVLTPRFDPDAALRLIEREQVTMLACVSTQFIMMLNSPVLDEVDLSSAAGDVHRWEAVPYERAAAFEERTGAAVLQFYGSERDRGVQPHPAHRTRRISGCGRPGRSSRRWRWPCSTTTAPTSRRRACPASRCAGARLPAPATTTTPPPTSSCSRPTGACEMGDIATIDADGYLRVVGRTSDFIIRGGQERQRRRVVEEAVPAPSPGSAWSPPWPWPDPVFGERVCVYVAGDGVTLDGITADLDRRGISKGCGPSAWSCSTTCPGPPAARSPKSELKADADRRAATDAEPAATSVAQG